MYWSNSIRSRSTESVKWDSRVWTKRRFAIKLIALCIVVRDTQIKCCGLRWAFTKYLVAITNAFGSKRFHSSFHYSDQDVVVDASVMAITFHVQLLNKSLEPLKLVNRERKKNLVFRPQQHRIIFHYFHWTNINGQLNSSHFRKNKQ